MKLCTFIVTVETIRQNNMPIYIYNRHAEKHIQGTQIHTNYKQYNIILALGNISQLLPQ